MRLRRIHWVTLDYVLAAFCALIIFLALYKGARVHPPPVTGWHARDWVPPLLAVCLSLPVAIRRRDPVIALVLGLVACAAVLLLDGRVTRGPFVPLALVLYVVAATCSRRAARAALAATLALFAAEGLIMQLGGEGAGNAVVVGLLLVIVWMVGYSVRQRRAYAARLRRQATDNAVTAERLRIARELHDVVAHSMTVVAVQAGFGEYVFDQQPADARAALAAIQTVTGEALADMQRMLGALRQAAPVGDAPDAAPPAGLAPAPLAPAAGLADLDRLIAGTAGAGVRVEVQRTGQARAIPAGIDLSAFRIIQEALTNVVKHSGADRCRVVIAYGDGELRLEVTDPGARAPALAGARAPGAGSAPGAWHALGAGHGIAGMAERVGLCGGEFTAGPLTGQGFRVAARFPLPGGRR
jgi:signal transduction histidine kinase